MMGRHRDAPGRKDARTAPAGVQPADVSAVPAADAAPAAARGTGLFVGGVVALFALGVSIRLYRIGEAGFWRDEATAAFWSQMSLGELLAALRRDVHAPLYYILLGAWSNVAGTSEWGLRSLNALLGAGCGVAAAWAYTPLLGRWQALLAGLLIAVMPGFVLYSQQLSVYPLLVLAATGATGATVRLLLQPDRSPIPMAALLATGLAAMVYTHMWSALAWLGLGITALGISLPPLLRRKWADVRWPLLAGHAAALGLWSPWLLAALGQARSRTMDHLPPTPSAPEILLETTQYWYNEPITALIAAGLLAASVALLVVGWWRPEERERRGAWLSLLLMVIVPHVACLIFALQRDIYYARYALVCAPAAVALLVATARLVPLQRPREAILQPPSTQHPPAYASRSASTPRSGGLAYVRAAVTVGIALALIGIPWLRNGQFGTIFMASYLPSPMREVARTLAREAGPRDVIVLYPELYAPSLNWYFRGPQRQICYPATQRVEVVDYSSFADRIEDPQSPLRVGAATLDALQDGGQLWLIYNVGRYRGRQGRINYGQRFDEFAALLGERFKGTATTDVRFWNNVHPHALESVKITRIAPLPGAAGSPPAGGATGGR